MSRDPVDRVLEHNMSIQPHDPIFNPHPPVVAKPAALYQPDQPLIKDSKPATGDSR